MQNKFIVPGINDNASKEELAKQIAEMMAAKSDMDPVDVSFWENDNITQRMVGL